MGLGPPALALYRQLKGLFVDGELYDGKRIKYISKERVVAEQLEQETRMFHSELAAVRAKVLSAIFGRELVGELGKRIRRRVVG